MINLVIINSIIGPILIGNCSSGIVYVLKQKDGRN